MEQSTIIIHWGEYDRSNTERFILSNFTNVFRKEWLDSDFARYCIETIDGCKYLGGYLIDSPWLGLIPPEKLSGGTQTLLAAYNLRDKAFPLRNLGDNCADALYISGIESPTQWTWMDYTPEFLPEQRIMIAKTGEVVLGKDWFEWSLDNAPDVTTLVPGLREYLDSLPEEERRYE